jgi:signal transduction histidine kinase
MSLGARTALAFGLTTLGIAVAMSAAVRYILHAKLDMYRANFEMMREMMNGFGPDLGALYRLVDAALGSVLVAGVVLIALAAAWIGFALARSLAGLDRALKRFAAGDLEASVSERGPAEIGRIARSANAMARQLDTARTDERELVAGIAHDLAHPLTALRGTLEAVRDGVVDISDAAVAERLFAGIDSLDATLADLRDVAAFDAGLLRLHWKHVEFGHLIESIHRMYADYADRRGITLRTEALFAVARSDPRRLQRLLENLTINAIQATQPGGTVTLRVCAQRDDIALEIEDEAGPAAAARVASALSTGRNTGLGLRVVRTMGKALNTQLDVRASRRGCIVRVRFECDRISPCPRRRVFPANASSYPTIH